MTNKKLSVSKQCMLLSLCRSRLYYKHEDPKQTDLEIMQLIDKIHALHPYYGVPRMTRMLREQGFVLGKWKVRRLMRKMCIQVLYPKRRTTKPAPGNETYPYLLRNMQIDRVNKVWEMDITYLPMKRGFMYLAAIIDVYSRCIVGWDISNTMEAEWCSSIVSQAIERHGIPEVFNTDQGSQFTSKVFTENLKNHNVKISMDGRGRATDDIYIERFWRSLKYEDIYLNAYDTPCDLRKGVTDYIYFYNNVRPHQSLQYRRPINVFKAIA